MENWQEKAIEGKDVPNWGLEPTDNHEESRLLSADATISDTVEERTSDPVKNTEVWKQNIKNENMDIEKLRSDIAQLSEAENGAAGDLEVQEKISKATSFKDLFSILDSIEGVQGSAKFFSRDTLKIYIEGFIKGSVEADRITNGLGLRDKVVELLADEFKGYEEFSKVISSIDPTLSLLNGPMMRQEILKGLISRSNNKRFGIYRSGAFSGKVIEIPRDATTSDFLSQASKLFAR